MPKIQVEIDVPEGFEFVRPYDQSCEFMDGESDEDLPMRRLIVKLIIEVRPAWQWPEWLTAPWIAADEDGAYFAYATDPIMVERMWISEGDCAGPLELSIFNFIPPKYDDWKNSKRHNPKYVSEAAQ